MKKDKKYYVYKITNNVNGKIYFGKTVDVGGESHHAAKLKEHDVVYIRSAWASGGITTIELSRQFHVRPATITKIVKRERWRHIP